MSRINTGELLRVARTHYINQCQASHFKPATILASFNSGGTVDNHHLSASWNCETAKEVLERGLRATEEEMLALETRIDRDKLRLTYLAACRPMIVAYQQEDKLAKQRWEAISGEFNESVLRPRLLEKINFRLAAIEKISETPLGYKAETTGQELGDPDEDNSDETAGEDKV